jgi:hypothetical protein
MKKLIIGLTLLASMSSFANIVVENVPVQVEQLNIERIEGSITAIESIVINEKRQLLVKCNDGMEEAQNQIRITYTDCGGQACTYAMALRGQSSCEAKVDYTKDSATITIIRRIPFVR